jgi:hypothetical protein
LARLTHTGGVSKSANILFLIVLVFWSVLVGVGDFVIIHFTVRQFLARNFSTARGRIVFSQVTQRRILRGGITIRYVYSINGRNYGGSRYRYDDHSLAMRWEEAVKKFPDHAQTTVYFDPNDPRDSLLSPGVGGGDLLLLLLSAPVNVVLLLLWGAAISRARDRWAPREAGGVKFFKRPGQLRVRLADTSALAAACYVIGGAAFICAFPVVVAFGFDPSVRLMEGVWAAILALGAGACCWRGLANASGKHDLVVDAAACIVTLPQTRERRAPVTLPIQAITAVSIQRRVSQSRSGGYQSYLPSLRCQEGDSLIRNATLVGWGWSEEKARAFGLWLSRHLGIEFIGAQEESAQFGQ